MVKRTKQKKEISNEATDCQCPRPHKTEKRVKSTTTGFEPQEFARFTSNAVDSPPRHVSRQTGNRYLSWIAVTDRYAAAFVTPETQLHFNRKAWSGAHRFRLGSGTGSAKPDEFQRNRTWSRVESSARTQTRV